MNPPPANSLHPQSGASAPSAGRFGKILGLAVVYLLLARTGLWLEMPESKATSMWLPSGIALAAVLLLGRDVWPGIWLGSFATNLWYFESNPASLLIKIPIAALNAIGSSLAALCGQYLMSRYVADCRRPLERVREVCAFMGLGGMVGCLISATFGVTALCGAGLASWSGYGQIWLTWWLGDIAGVFVITPLLLVWSRKPHPMTVRQRLEMVACFTVLAVVTWHVFVQNTGFLFSGKPLAFVLIPFLIWPTARFGQRGAASASAIVAILSVWGTVHGTGPFHSAAPGEALFLLELFLSVVVLTALCMAATTTQRQREDVERQHALDELESRMHARTVELNRRTEQFAASEAEFRAIFENIQDVYVRTDLECNIQLINPAIQRYGYRVEELVGTPLPLLAASPEECECCLRELPQRKLVTDRELTFHRKDGQPFTVSANACVLSDAQGRPTGVECLLHDITERVRVQTEMRHLLQGAERARWVLLSVLEDQRRTEAALRESEERFSKAFHASPAIIAISTYPDGEYVDVNQHFTRTLGYSREETIGRKALDLGVWVRPEDRVPILRALERNELVRDVECQLRTKAGEVRTFSVSVEKVMIGQRMCLLFINHDITERKRAEAALRQSQEQFQQLFQFSPLAAVIYSARDGRIMNVNTRFLELFDYRPAEAIGHTGMELGLWCDLSAREQLMARMQREKEVRDFEARLRDKHGREYDLWLYAQEIELPDGPMVIVQANDVTERKRALEALRASEQRLRAIFDTEPECVKLLAADGSLLEMNPAGLRMIEAESLDQVRNHCVYPLVVDEHRAAFRELTEKVFRGETGALEFQIAGLKGGRRWLETHATPLYDEAGKVVSLLGVTRDITERKRAEQRIAHLNRVYAVLSDTSQMIVRERNPQAMFNEACRIAVEKGGFRMAWIGMLDPTGQQLAPMASAGMEEGYLSTVKIDLRDPTRIHGPAARCILSGEHAICEDIEHDPLYRPWRDEALRRGYRSSGGFPLKIEGKVVGVFSLYAGEPGFFDPEELALLDELALDIGFGLEVDRQESARRHVEQALRASEERFRELAENIEDVFWVSAAHQMEVLYVSPSYEKIWGRPCKSLYDEPCSWVEAVHREDRERVLKALETRQASGKYDVEYRINRPDGTMRWIRDQAFPVRDDAGQLVRIVGVARDITDTRKLEEQLRQSQKMEAIGQLAGGVAHDFNNILAAIIMQTELTLIGQELPESIREDLRQIRIAAGRAADLTRQLLLFSRKQVMQSRELDLNEVVTSLAKMLQRIIGEDVRLQLHLHPAPLAIHADAGMLDQVLMNLAVNARDAMPGGGRLLIETMEKIVEENLPRQHPDAAPGRYVCLSVTDTGTGIAPEILPRIFEPFFTTKEPGKGTGLGLATVFGIVQQHHGWITVASQPGQGANFRIFLPAIDVNTSASSQAAKPPRPRGGTETILLAEDDLAVRTLTRVVLEQNGYRVLEAVNGVEALKLWNAERASVALLLTDLVMPAGLSGQELARRVQADKPGVKAIFISGYSAEIAGRQLELRPGENLLQKPFAPDELLQTIRRCLDA